MGNIQPGFVFISLCFSVVSIQQGGIPIGTILKDTAEMLTCLPARNFDVRHCGILT